MAEEVLTSRDGSVLTLTLNRPEVYNAFNRALHDALRGGARRGSRPRGAGRRSHRCGTRVLLGAGSEGVPGDTLGRRDPAASRGDVPPQHPRIRELEKPVIAAVNGPCAGAGLSLAAACDVRIGSDAANFVPGFIGIGLVPDSGGSWFLHRLLGFSRAFEWMVSNRKLRAEEALEWGLVSEVVPADGFHQRVAERAALVRGPADSGRGDDEAALRARPRRVPRGAARARGRAPAGGDGDGGLRRRRASVPREAPARLQGPLGRGPAQRHSSRASTLSTVTMPFALTVTWAVTCMRRSSPSPNVVSSPSRVRFIVRTAVNSWGPS